MSRFSLFGSKFKTSAFSGKKISSFSPSSKPRKAFKETGFHRSLRLESLEDRSLLSISLGGHVWLDANADGLHGTAESAFQGASVELYSSTNATVGDSDDVLVARATTDATGSYNFTDQTAGNYFTTVRIPAGYAFTTQNAGTDDALDSDVNAFGVSNLITLADGESLTTLDAGLTGSAPAFGSAASIDASYSDSANAVAIDPNGNIYITGNYEGVIDFDPGIGVYNLTSTGDSSAFIAKYSSAGALVWVKNFGTTGNNSGFSIVYSSEGGIIVTGSFDGTADFNPGGTASTLTSAGGPDIFVCYYDAQGTFRWVKGFGGTGYDVGHNLTQADDGTICVTGYFSNTVDFDTTESTCIFTSNGSTDAFILKMDFDGSFIWAKQNRRNGNRYGQQRRCRRLWKQSTQSAPSSAPSILIPERKFTILLAHPRLTLRHLSPNSMPTVISSGQNNSAEAVGLMRAKSSPWTIATSMQPAFSKIPPTSIPAQASII